MAKHWLNFALFCIIAVLLSYLGCQHRNFASKQRLTTNLIKGLQDTLKSERDKNFHQISQISVLEGERNFLENDLVTKDSMLIALKEALKNNKKADNVIVTKVVTNYVSTTKTDSIYNVDTIWVDSLAFLFPEYKTSWSDQWSSGEIVANKDSIFKKFVVYNDFDVWQQIEGKGKNKHIQIYWKNKNPNTETVGMRSWRVEQPKRKNFVVVLQIGGGLIFPEMKFRPFVGFGIGYKLFEF